MTQDKKIMPLLSTFVLLEKLITDAVEQAVFDVHFYFSENEANINFRKNNEMLPYVTEQFHPENETSGDKVVAICRLLSNIFMKQELDYMPSDYGSGHGEYVLNGKTVSLRYVSVKGYPSSWTIVLRVMPHNV